MVMMIDALIQSPTANETELAIKRIIIRGFEKRKRNSTTAVACFV
jgi:hypothetical protein